MIQNTEAMTVQKMFLRMESYNLLESSFQFSGLKKQTEYTKLKSLKVGTKYILCDSCFPC